MDIQAFVAKHGTRTLGHLVGEYIKRAGAFPGDLKRAHEIGMVLGDLESALAQVEKSSTWNPRERQTIRRTTGRKKKRRTSAARDAEGRLRQESAQALEKRARR